MNKVALITGITGQDGSYLTEHLLNKGYEVHGLVRRSASFNTDRIDHLYRDPHEQPRLKLHHGDMCDASSLRTILDRVKPDEVYNLAAQSHVRTSFDIPIYTLDTIVIGTANLLEAVRDAEQSLGRRIKFYQASSSEMYGKVLETPQTENTPFNPQSPYAVAKVAAHQLATNYREAYGMFICCGILFNHESPRRGETFVTRKITRAVGRIKHGLQDKVYLGNLNAQRDWGHAADYVEAMYMMLQASEPTDYVVATGETHKVIEFLDAAFRHVGLVPYGDYVEFDERYLRPTEVDLLLGDPAKIRNLLGWWPTTTFDLLVQQMVDHDMELAADEKTLLERKNGATP